MSNHKKTKESFIGKRFKLDEHTYKLIGINPVDRVLFITKLTVCEDITCYCQDNVDMRWTQVLAEDQIELGNEI